MAEQTWVTEWATAISTHADNGRKIFWRFAKEFSLDFDRTTQPDRIIIVWEYQSATGQPLPDEHARMNQLEDALQATLHQDSFSTLALVSTGENRREWIYYAESEGKFMNRLNLALENMPEFPIEIHIDEDRQWSTYDEFKAGVKQSDK